MLLQPKRRKFQKDRKGRIKGLAYNANRVSYGQFGLKAEMRGRLTARQIEAARQVMKRFLKRSGKLWIRIFPDKPITKKPLETRMGNGKGPIEYWVAVVKPGHMLFELDGVSKELATEAFRLAAGKLPIRVIFEERRVM